MSRFSRFRVQKFFLVRSMVAAPMVAMLCLAAISTFADYPIASQHYAADPTGLEYNGRIYLYCSNDEENGTNGYIMSSIACFSTDDLKNWTDHGAVFKAPQNASWASLTWAPSAVSNNSRVCLYFANGAGSIGVATSSVPTGPFQDARGSALVNGSTPGASTSTQWLFDPCAFIDDDGQAYLYFGGQYPTNARVIRLNANLTSVSGSASPMVATNFFEASYMHKRAGTYYYTYCNRFEFGAVIYCETNSNPTNGFIPQNTVLANPPQNVNNNNHHSIFPFQGNWYIAYHNRAAALQNGLSSSAAVYKRSLCLDRVNYNANGSIQQVTITTDGLTQLKNLNPYNRVEGETIAQQSGVKTEVCSEGGMNVTAITNGSWIRVRGVDFSTGASNFYARVASAGSGGNLELHLDSLAGTLLGTCAVPPTGGWQSWTTVSTNVGSVSGVHDLYLKFTGGVSNLFNLNWWQFQALGGPSISSSVAIEAESGALGSGWALSNSATPIYITITSNTNINNPGNSNRVATYSVTFPVAGTYQLYARLRVGPDTFNDDSLFYGNGFGTKSPGTDADWILANGLGSAGFSNSADVVTGGGTLGSGMWKWINLSQFTSQPGFTVNAGNLTQTFQIGARENGLDLDKFVFGIAGYTYTVSDLDSGSGGTSPVPAPTFPLAATNSLGVSLVVGSNGVYSVSFASPAWTFAGYLAQGLTGRAINSGTDNIGAYSEITFNYTKAVAHAGGIRLYNNSPVVLFTDTTLAAGTNDLAFPRWITYPAVQNHLTFGNTFSLYNFTTLFDDNLWLFFQTNHDTFITSAATNYMVASTRLSSDGSISCGINAAITQLPSGFTHRVILTAQNGINQSYSTWGDALLSLAGKTPPANDAAVELNQLGYWTDNGATYYYANPPGGIAARLIAMKDEYASKGVPLGYLQLDSWWYQKGNCHCWAGDPGVSWPSNGIYLYLPDAAQFPGGIGAFQQQLGIPLMTHARWIDMASPYRTNYTMSGNVCVDPAYWTNIMSYLKNSGVVSYEQDWLGVAGIPNMNLNDPPAYLNLMAAAAAANGLNLQYCMVQGRDFLQGSLYTNLMTVRTSQDDFREIRWTEFLYGSRIAQAMGIWPWTDVFMSSETRNLLISTLSAGPVGPGDALGAVQAANLSKSVRPDGVIVKPDLPLVPVDDTYVNDALHLNRPFVAMTRTDHGGSRALYVFAYGENAANLSAGFTPAAYGISGNAWVYDYFAATGTVVNAGSAFNFTTTMPHATNGGSYYITVPIGPSGIAFLGDTNKFVTRGKKRIASVSDTGLLRATVAFAAGESNVTLCGYAPSSPYALALAGSTNNLTYNPVTHLFTLNVSPGSSGTATVAFSLAPVPSLSMAPDTAGQFQISWPAAAAGYLLEMTTNLLPPVVWTEAPEAVTTSNGQNTVSITNADPAAFYRLKQ